MKILLVAAKLIQADKRTRITKLIFAFRNFANASRNIQTWTPILHRWYM